MFSDNDPKSNVSGFHGSQKAVGHPPSAPPATEMTTAGHPRLYFTAEELQRLWALRTQGVHARIWTNLRDSTERCLALSPRQGWIAPVSPGPDLMRTSTIASTPSCGDLAITEHLAFRLRLQRRAEVW